MIVGVRLMNHFFLLILSAICKNAFCHISEDKHHAYVKAADCTEEERKITKFGLYVNRVHFHRETSDKTISACSHHA